MKLDEFLLFVLAVALAGVPLASMAGSTTAPVVIKATIQCDAAFWTPQCSWSADKDVFVKVFGEAAGKHYEAGHFEETVFSNEPAVVSMLMDASFLQIAKKTKCQYSADVTMRVSHPEVEMAMDDEGLSGTMNLDSILSTSGLKLSPLKAQAGYDHCHP